MQELKIVEPSGRGNKTPVGCKKEACRAFFLGLGVFIEVGLLFCGSYLLADAILQPMDAGTFSVVGGGMFFGAGDGSAFSILAWPSKRGSMSCREKPAVRPSEPLLGKIRGAQGPTRRQHGWPTKEKGRLASGPM